MLVSFHLCKYAVIFSLHSQLAQVFDRVVEVIEQKSFIICSLYRQQASYYVVIKKKKKVHFFPVTNEMNSSFIPSFWVLSLPDAVSVLHPLPGGSHHKHIHSFHLFTNLFLYTTSLCWCSTCFLFSRFFFFFFTFFQSLTRGPLC